MPINTGYFIIRKPRVSPINANSTLPPTSEGNYIMTPCMTITYVGVVSSANLTITGAQILTLINEEPSHEDNLTISYSGMSLSELSALISKNNNYQVTVFSGFEEYLCLLKGITQVNILNNTCVLYCGTEDEYLIDVYKEGVLGNSSISWKLNDFSYSNQTSRWMLNSGKIYDIQNLDIPISGSTYLSNGAYIKFFNTTFSNALDVNRYTSYTDITLAESLISLTSEISFPASPILMNSSIDVKVNNTSLVYNEGYLLTYGTSAEIRSSYPQNYNITSSTNILKIRHNSDPIQTFILPTGLNTALDLVNTINATASNFIAYVYEDSNTSYKYLSLIENKGTEYNQLRIEDGSANSIFGFTNLMSAKGDGSGKIKFLSKIENEDHTPEENESLSSFIVDIVANTTTHPFIGVNTDNFKVFKNNLELIKDEDFFVTEQGSVDLISIKTKENLVGGILKLDNNLFTKDYFVYDNDTLLTESTDYNINTEAGWISLTTSAFPKHVYSATYTNKNLGFIEKEVILGNSASITGTLASPYSLPSTERELILSVNNTEDQSILIPYGSAVTLDLIVTSINESCTGIIASDYNNYLRLTTIKSGLDSSITIKNGSANTYLGLTNNQSSSGTGAVGGEQALSIASPPMVITGFVVPSGGNTLIIKNNDVTDRYFNKTIIKINNDFYQVNKVTVDSQPNLINTLTGPYTILTGTNDVFSFTIDSGDENTVTFTSGSNITIYDIVAEINNVKNDCCEVIILNGLEKIKIKGNTKIAIGYGTANRTLGFDPGKEDTVTKDTILEINTIFKNTYLNPKIYTTSNAIDFYLEENIKEEIPQNSNQIIIYGDVTDKYTSNILLKLDNKYFHKVNSSQYTNEKTIITLMSKIEIPIYSDTILEYTNNPIFEEGDTKLKTDLMPILTESFILYENDLELKQDTDYTISSSGDITLTSGITQGKTYSLSYIGKDFITSNTNLKITYTYFDFLKEKSNIKVSFEVDNPDNFYMNTLYGETLMSSFKSKLKKRNNQIANASSSGFPTGEISQISNNDNGSSSYYYDLGDVQDNLDLAYLWYSFFHNRILYFEEEKRILTGYIIGAENGYLTKAQIEDSVNIPPTRLFPLSDSRADTEKSNPLKLPALFGLNQNDSGDNSLGIESTYALSTIDNEINQIDLEINHLNSLLAINVFQNNIQASGDLTPTSTETLIVYAETENPTGTLIQQNLIEITFEPKISGLAGETTDPYTPSEIASKINNAVSGNFASGTTITASKVSPTDTRRCFYIIQDAPSLNFGTGSCAAIRSRHILWTAGHQGPSSIVPGNTSVHIDINTETTYRNTSITQHQYQITQLIGQMEEWLSPYLNPFTLAKTEKSNSNTWIENTTNFNNDSISFQNTKEINIFNALDYDSTLTTRIANLTARKNLLLSRKSEITTRINQIGTTLTNEDIYNIRYAWLTLLTNRESGYYMSKKRIIDQEVKKQAESVNNTNVLNSITA